MAVTTMHSRCILSIHLSVFSWLLVIAQQPLLNSFFLPLKASDVCQGFLPRAFLFIFWWCSLKLSFCPWLIKSHFAAKYPTISQDLINQHYACFIPDPDPVWKGGLTVIKCNFLFIYWVQTCRKSNKRLWAITFNAITHFYSVRMDLKASQKMGRVLVLQYIMKRLRTVGRNLPLNRLFNWLIRHLSRKKSIDSKKECPRSKCVGSLGPKLLLLLWSTFKNAFMFIKRD